MEKQLFHHDKWEWMRIDVISEKEIASLPKLPPASKNWLDSLQEEKNSNLEMETTEEGSESMWGSIIYHQEIEDHDKQTVLQYYLSKDRLITSQIDVSFLYRLSEEQLLEKLQTAENTIEGFMILLGRLSLPSFRILMLLKIGCTSCYGTSRKRITKKYWTRLWITAMKFSSGKT